MATANAAGMEAASVGAATATEASPITVAMM